MRKCGDCQLCCKLLPVPPLKKGAGVVCQFQKFRKGCAVHHTARMPFECGVWNCRWLVNDDAAELSRPDRAHYVINLMPDFITITNGDGSKQNIQVDQIWVDPKYPDAGPCAAGSIAAPKTVSLRSFASTPATPSPCSRRPSTRRANGTRSAAPGPLPRIHSQRSKRHSVVARRRSSSPRGGRKRRWPIPMS